MLRPSNRCSNQCSINDGGPKTYDDIAAIFLTPSAEVIATPTVPDSSARRLRDSIEAIATIGWWSRSAADALTGLGHGFFDGYVWGRAASLGADVSPSVVVSGFGVFNAELLAPVYAHARTISSQAAVLEARAQGASDGLRAATANIAADTIATCGDRLLEALATLDAGPRHLFGALRSLDVPTNPWGRLWRAAELVREHRGDTHLAACVAAGLEMAETNILTELWLGFPIGMYSSSRGFGQSQTEVAVASLEDRGWIADGTLTAGGTSARNAIETATDLGQQQLVRALGNDLDPLCTTLAAISAAVIENRAAPADPRKRAAG